MEHEICRAEIARYAKTGADRVLIDEELIVIPAEASADRPFAQPDQVLHERGLLETEAASRKLERGRSSRIELRRVGDDVAEVFAKVGEIAFEPGFEFVAAPMIRRGSLQIFLSESAILKRNDGRGLRIGAEADGVAAHHPMEVGEQVLRKDVLVRNNAKGFEIVTVLDLPRVLLELFVGHQELGKLATQCDSETVVVGEIAIVVRREVGSGRGVGVVLENRRIQVPVGNRSVPIDGKRILSPAVLCEEIPIGGTEAAPR